MSSNAKAILGAAAALSFFLAGCSGEADGSARPVPNYHSDSADEGKNPPTSNTASSPEENLPKHGAPSVDDPLDASMLQNDICAAMTDVQAKKFPGDLSDSEVDDKGYCDWTYEKDLFNIGYIGGRLGVDNQYGLSSYYTGEQSAKSDPLEPVNGYPAVRYDLDLETDGNCVIVMGLRDDLTYDVLVQLYDEHPSYDSPCQVARDFAKIVVDNLKEAQ